MEAIVAIGAVIGVFALMIGWFIAAALIEAWALVLLNGWFVAPTFGTPTFGYWTAAGLALFAGLLCNHNDLATEVEGKDVFPRMLRVVLRPLLSLAAGYCFFVWSAA